MAFISDKKRKSLIHRTNRGYGFRKFLLFIDILGLIGFIVSIFVCGFYGLQLYEGEDPAVLTLTPLGWGMLAYAIIISLLSIASFILIFTIRSPKTVTKENRVLQSSALAGQKIHRIKNTPNEIVKARTTLKKKK